MSRPNATPIVYNENFRKLLLYPFAMLFLNGSKFIMRIFLGQNLSENKHFFNKTDLDEYLTHINTNNEQASNNVEVEMLQNTLQLSSKKIRECMIPRTEIIALNVTSTVDDLKQKFIETKLSKILIYKNNIDNIIGYVHSSDLFRNPRNIRSLLLPIPFVPETMLAMQLLSEFIDEDKGVALVVDEFGGTSGMITIEDVTEEIVGEIEDEYDVNQNLIEKLEENEYNVLARIDVLLLNKDLDIDLPESDESYDSSSLRLAIALNCFPRHSPSDDESTIERGPSSESDAAGEGYFKTSFASSSETRLT